ncbi:MAG: type II toxin-antitoxin system HicA family toxin [Anaerolineae bacterium]|nr:type II toxin-antitoxin system HicA family toxin [Anaerolineae bacterium]
MPKLPSVRSREVIAALKKAGWTEQRQMGSHRHMKHSERGGRVTIPVHSKSLAKGTLRNIIRQAGLTVDEFLALL